MIDSNNNTVGGKTMSIRQKFGNDDIVFFRILGASFTVAVLGFLLI